MTSPKKDTATYVLAAALVSLSAAIIYFAYVLTQINASLPVILDEVQITQDKLEPVLTEVTEIRLLLPGIVEEAELIRQEIPPIVEEISLIREEIPPVLVTIDGLLQLIPQITEDIDDIVAIIPPLVDEIAAIRRQAIPPILEEVAAIRITTIPPVLDEMAEIRLSVANILAELEVLRAEIPGYFDRAEILTADIQSAGQEASEGAVVGVFTGIIKAPLNLVSSLGGSSSLPDEISQNDLDIAGDAARDVADFGTEGAYRDWRNPDSGMHGRITLTSIRSASDKIISATILDDRDNLLEQYELHVVKDADDSWVVVE